MTRRGDGDATAVMLNLREEEDFKCVDGDELRLEQDLAVLHLGHLAVDAFEVLLLPRVDIILLYFSQRDICVDLCDAGMSYGLWASLVGAMRARTSRSSLLPFFSSSRRLVLDQLVPPISSRKLLYRC